MRWSKVFVDVAVFALGLALLVWGLGRGQERETDALKSLAVLEGGRVKPFDTFARETLRLLYGKESFDGKPAVEVVMTWLIAPQVWDEKLLVEIRHAGLKNALQIDPSRTHFSPSELFRNDRFSLVLQELRAKAATKEKLNPYYQAAQRLENQLGQYQVFKSGSGLHVLPPPAGQDGWKTVISLDGEPRDQFARVTSSFVHALLKSSPEAASLEVPAGASSIPLAQAVQEFQASARKINPAIYGDPGVLAVEIYYNWLHPFRISWLVYLCAVILMALAWQSGRPVFSELGWAAAVVAFLIHIYGFGLRMYLTGRPPVSNIYETVVWVAFGAVLFAMIFEFLHRRKFILLAGAAVAVLCLIVADIAPTILDKSLQPLEPVLRSNLWLTIHVLMITISYSAFFLGWGLGVVGLGMILKGDSATSRRVREVSESLYRALQVGVVLLAAGTILGGVWADYSWGRFWGWDPKETWALIALLGYLALLHARLVGWAQNFGMLAGAVVAFSLVIMSWYGVNFVLGAGLHTYGFGAGGIQYVSAFVAGSLLYVGYVSYVHKFGKAV